jgi:hypothetical protein
MIQSLQIEAIQVNDWQPTTTSRPDVMQAVGHVARFQATP